MPIGSVARSGALARLSLLDRRLGSGIRAGTARMPGVADGLAGAAVVLSPAFRAVVAVLILRPRSRGTGTRALAAGVAAALLARAARDRIGRGRPGPREEGGFPSRHAAAAAAIATAVAGTDRRLGHALAGAAVVGLLGRVSDGHHEPADVLAGAAGGWAIGRLARLPSRPAMAVRSLA